MTDQRWLHYVAERLRTEPEFLGFLLARYQELKGIQQEDLARELGASAEAMDVLARCGLPRRQNFFEDIQRIAKRAGVSARVLGGICGQMFMERPDLWPDAPQWGRREEWQGRPLGGDEVRWCGEQRDLPGTQPGFPPVGRLLGAGVWMAAARRYEEEAPTDEAPTEAPRATEPPPPELPKAPQDPQEG